MTEFTDAELSVRGAATLVASWEAYACGAPGATVQRAPGVVSAVFPRDPERTVSNNALLQRDLAATARAAAGVERFAAWVHEGDAAMRGDLERRGSTRATPRRGRWAWRSVTSAGPARRSRAAHWIGARTGAGAGCRQVSSAEPIAPPSTS